jgi:hypothetical protein
MEVNSLLPFVRRLGFPDPSGRLCEAAAALPFCSAIIVECPLEGTEPPLGLSVPVPIRPDLTMYRWVETVGLEYDLPFAGLDRAATFFGLVPDAPIDASSLEELVRLPAIFADAQNGDVMISHVGVMLSRPGAPVRINVASRDPQAMLDYLERVGAPVPRALLEELAPLLDHFACALDYDGVVAGRFGIECYALDRLALCEYFVKRGWCDRQLLPLLRDWPRELPGPPPEELPESVARVRWLAGPIAASRILRTINHVKVVSNPARGIHVKAYLAAHHCWR